MMNVVWFALGVVVGIVLDVVVPKVFTWVKSVFSKAEVVVADVKKDV